MHSLAILLLRHGFAREERASGQKVTDEKLISAAESKLTLVIGRSSCYQQFWKGNHLAGAWFAIVNHHQLAIKHQKSPLIAIVYYG